MCLLAFATARIGPFFLACASCPCTVDCNRYQILRYAMYYYCYYYLLQLSFHLVAVVLTLVTNKNKYIKETIKNTVNTSKHVTKPPIYNVIWNTEVRIQTLYSRCTSNMEFGEYNPADKPSPSICNTSATTHILWTRSVSNVLHYHQLENLI